MRLIVTFLLLFCVPVVTAAAEVLFVSDKVPYQPLLIADFPANSMQIFDELTGVAQLYQFEVAESQPLTYRLKIPYIDDRQIDLNTIVVREEVRGVSEVIRTSGETQVWSLSRNWWTGDRYLVSEPVEVPQIESGVYRLEVSSPSNQGKYVLELGEVPAITGGFFGQVRYQWQIDRFFEKTWLALLQAIPVWIVVFLGALWLWRRRLATLAGFTT